MLVVIVPRFLCFEPSILWAQLAHQCFAPRMNNAMVCISGVGQIETLPANFARVRLRTPMYAFHVARQSAFLAERPRETARNSTGERFRNLVMVIFNMFPHINKFSVGFSTLVDLTLERSYAVTRSQSCADTRIVRTGGSVGWWQKTHRMFIKISPEKLLDSGNDCVFMLAMEFW